MNTPRNSYVFRCEYGYICSGENGLYISDRLVDSHAFVSIESALSFALATLDNRGLDYDYEACKPVVMMYRGQFFDIPIPSDLWDDFLPLSWAFPGKDKTKPVTPCNEG